MSGHDVLGLGILIDAARGRLPESMDPRRMMWSLEYEERDGALRVVGYPDPVPIGRGGFMIAAFPVALRVQADNYWGRLVTTEWERGEAS